MLAEFGKAGKGGVPMPNIPQMSSVWSDLGAAWVKSTKGSGSTKAATAFKARPLDRRQDQVAGRDSARAPLPFEAASGHHPLREIE